MVECHLGPIQKNPNIFENGLIFLRKSTFRLPETSESVHQNRPLEWVYMVATGREMKIKFLHGKRKVREFHFESAKIYVLERSQKVKF